MKKKIIIISCSLFAVVAIVIFCLSPCTCFRVNDKISIYRVCKIIDGKENDITNAVAIEELCEILPLMRMQRTALFYGPFPMKDAKYEISGRCGGEGFHIILGVNEISHYSTGRRGSNYILRFTDLSANHWAYGHIMEATNNHKYERVMDGNEEML